MFRDLDADAGPVVVVGGDGSLNAALNGLGADEPRVAFAGAGTVNVIDLELGRRPDAEGLAAALAEGRFRRLPAFTAAGVHGLLFAEAGFQARIVAGVNAWRRRRAGHGKLEFLLAAVRVLPASFGRTLFVEHEGRRLGPFSNVLLTRVRRYGGSLPMPLDPSLGRALETEGFQVVAWRTANPLTHVLLLAVAGLRLLPSTWRVWRRLGFLETFPAQRVRLEGPPDEAVHVDAETELEAAGGALRLPLEVAFEGRAIRLVD